MKKPRKDKNQRRTMCLVILSYLLSASSVGAVTFDWAEIGNPGNSADNTGYGSVGYEYRIATTEVTTAQYVEFLNAVAGVDTHGLYSTSMTSTFYNGIVRSGSGTQQNPFTYNSNAGWENRSVQYVSWYDALRFTNWLHKNQPTGAQNANTTEYGAYDMSQGASVVRLSGSIYGLPTEDEWYKAAYYDPLLEVYYDYATKSNTIPNTNIPTNDTGNSANWRDGAEYTLGSPYWTTEVGAYSLSASAYGTYDQTGNVFEWIETLESDKRIGRSSAFYSSASNMSSSYRLTLTPSNEPFGVGFRVAGFNPTEEENEGDGETVPEPASLGLVLLSVSGLVLRWARKA